MPKPKTIPMIPTPKRTKVSDADVQKLKSEQRKALRSRDDEAEEKIRVTFRISKASAKAFKVACAKADVTQSEQIEALINTWMNQKNSKA